MSDKSQDSKDHLDKVINTIGDPLFVKDREHLWILLNDAFCEFINQPRENLLGKSDYDFFPKEQADIFWEKDELVFNSGRENINEEKFTGTDGILHTIITKKNIYADQSGDMYLVGIIRDITEQKNAEQKRALLFSALEQSSETIVITNKEGDIQYVNPQFEYVTGYTRAEAVGKNPRILKSGKHEPFFYKDMWDILTGGLPWHGNIINKRKDGTLFEEEATINPIFDETGEIVNFVAVKRDVTEKIKLESLVRQREKLSAVGQLAAGVAHELNNPLGVILGYAQSLMQGMTPSDPLYDPLKQMEHEALRCGKLVQNLLNFSRNRVPALSSEAVQPLMEEALGLVEIKAKLKKVEVSRRFSPKMPKILVDRMEIQQVVINLCTNAIDAMPNGGKLIISAAPTTKDGREWIKIELSDTGVGIPADIQKNIYDPFFTTKEIGKGTGLGLSLVQDIIQKHKGTIELTSAEGVGTTFTLHIPVTSSLS